MAGAPTQEPVAIVGRGCVLPGGLDPDTFIAAILRGDDLVSAVPDDRWGVPDAVILAGPGGTTADRAHHARGGYVTAFEDSFRVESLRSRPASLGSPDPIVRWLVHAGDAALAEAGVSDRARVGAVVGNLSFPGEGMARAAAAVWVPELAQRLGHRAARSEDRFFSARPAADMARALGLGRRTLTLDAACASALYALRIAADRLASGECDAVLAGAVNRADDLFLHVGFTALKALSPTGRSRPFHRDADGLLPAEGCALFVLRRLRDAVRDGDRIHGVIRGIGLANDGRPGGILSPSAEGQARAIRAAWAASGVDPRALGLLECHATGTPVGDATELASTASALPEVRGLPIGSVKSNLGHPVTAAGGAALLKVLGAMSAGVRPATLHVDAPSDAATDGPFRVLAAPEPWTGPKVAAVSAFGFGGNDAHLVVTEDAGNAGPVAARPAVPVVAVAFGARGAAFADAASLVAALASGRSAVVDGQARLAEIAVGLTELRFPPRDLDVTLAQQLLVMEAVREAWTPWAGVVDPARTGVWIGIEADPEVCRYGLRWRLGAVPGLPDLAAARDGVVPVLTSAGVVGTMPNIPANRLSNRFDLRGPGFVVSSERRSGLDALALAASALRAGEVDAAIVGAVDLSCEPVHGAACEDPAPPGDMAVAIVLLRAADAARAGLPALATLDDGRGVSCVLGDGGIDLAGRWGRAWAADGLVHAVAGLASVAHGLRPTGDGAAPAWDDDVRRVRVVASGPDGCSLAVGWRTDGRPLPPPAPWRDPGPVRIVPAHPAPVRVPTAAAPRAPVPLEPAVTRDDVLVLPAAPWLPPVMASSAAPVAAPPAAAPVAPGPAAAPVVAPAPVAAPPVAASGAGALAASLAHVSAAHARHLAHQQTLQARFLAMRGDALRTLFGGGPGVAAPAATAVVPTPAVVAVPTIPSPVAPARPPTPPATAAPIPAPVRPPPPTVPAAPPPAVVAPAPSAPTSRAWENASVTPPPAGVVVRRPDPVPMPSASTFPGLSLDRAGLEVHASGDISTIFGAAFADQDAYARQCRMPEPPLLLADRLLGIDVAPHDLGTGTLWTETDVGSQDWYLFQGRMPAGVMIEAGQADLMLISWMGIDRFNASERVYRLLGCTLTYHDRLPMRGDTLRYDIHVDGHAKDGDVRLFFFHYDCVDQAGRPRLSVRGGQAGFFTDEELANSAGILWSPETGAHDRAARLDAPAVRCARTSFGPEALEAFAAGDAFACFGEGFELSQAHNDTPRIAPAPMRFLHRITDCRPDGGPWGRGYLRGEWDVSASDWFFEGHFKNDPCMPGTLMFEGCLQTLAFYLASLGYTLPRDGWRFEPVPGNPIPMRCRGQVLPTDRTLVYEVFVEEVHDGPEPTVYADLLCTIDGLKAFHARRCGLRLTPSWPLDHLRPALIPAGADRGAVATVDGFRFGYDSMIACAWGRPSEAFGPMYARFDGPLKVPRLPGPPYHFISRATEIEGPIGGMQVGTRVRMAYDIPDDAWYFDDNGAEVMPFAVLLEAALQPCGWLASYVGSALTTDQELFFRNLDGTATLHVEPVRTSGTLVTDVTITNISKSAGMIIQSFDVTCTLGDTVVYAMKTVFGFFPAAALATQKGLPFPAGDAERVMAEPAQPVCDLTARPSRFFGGSLRLPPSTLCMIDRVVSYEPDGGRAGLGRLRSAKDVDPADWFFKAHFFQDPVQPGSLGIEAMLHLLQWWMIETGQGAGMAAPRFEPLALGVPHRWTYRGQVTPVRERIVVELEVTEVRAEAGGRVIAEAVASLWCDGLRIYEASLAMAVVDGPPDGSRGAGASSARRFDPAVDRWLADHAPTWTVPALPLMTLVDQAVGAVRHAEPGRAIRSVEDAEVLGWVVVDAPVTLAAEIEGDDAVCAVTLTARVDGHDARPVFRARVRLGDDVPAAPAPAGPCGGDDVPDPYASGALFHGPAFQAVTRLVRDRHGASAWLDLDRLGVPPGALGQGLLDAATHAIPHDAMHVWFDALGDDVAAYPRRLHTLRWFVDALPVSGTVRVDARPVGLVDGAPVVDVEIVAEEGVIAAFTLEEVVVPKGPIGRAPGPARVAFLRDRVAVEGVGLHTVDDDGATVVRAADVAASGWLPGTLDAVYALTPGVPRLEAIARRAHVARVLGVHPSTVSLGDGVGVAAALPLNPVRTDVARGEGLVRVTGAERLDLAPVEAWWSSWFGVGPWTMEDVDYALIERFIRRVVVADPAGLRAIHGRPALFLANHQTAIESLLFSVVIGALTGVPCVTIAKAEHRATWLGRLIQHGFSHPGVRDPRVITYFEREDKESLHTLIAELARDIAAGERSGMVHVEGTRAFSARHRTVKMSGAFLDMAIAVGCPVVPVRFTGGLPVKPLSARTEFPVGLGRQDLWIGRPLQPEALKALGYKERKQAVLDGIHAIGPAVEAEVPLPGSPEQVAAAAARASARGIEPEHAVLAEVLLRSSRRAAEGTRRLVAWLEDGVALSSDTPEAAWLFELGRRLGG